jgi:type IX secretion system substrate protein
MPVSNISSTVNYETYFSGERFRALPVNVGDMVRIVSRTSLWKEGVNTAFAQALTFTVSRSTVPPVFTGPVVQMQDTVVTIVPSKFPWKNKQGIMDTLYHTEWLNVIQVTEDREYPKAKGYYSEPSNRVGKDALGRDSIISVTAIDLNKFYDPRSHYEADKYANLYYDWYAVYEGTDKPNGNAGLNHWLFGEWYPAGLDVPEVINPNYGAQGYMAFRGRAINPYVVPGGEELVVTVHNFPPHYRTLDSLKAQLDAGLLTQDEYDQYYTTFMKYLNAPVYDYDYDNNVQVNDRFLNQDSIDIGLNYEARHRFKILVNDSTPIFLNPDDLSDPDDDTSPPVWPKDLTVDLDYRGENVKTIGTYEPSDYPCVSKRGINRLQANLTNKLRFQVDFNTDDELEDSWANEYWDFRYGKTTYGFLNRAMRSNDAAGDGEEDITLEDVEIDELNYGGVELIVQSRPIWLDNQFLYQYDSDTEVDEFGVDFSSKGQLNVRIDRDVALDIIDPVKEFPGQDPVAKNTDTSFYVVVNDGHGMINSKKVEVYINVEPMIITESLPDAIEGTDYNPELLDSLRMIRFFDANINQDHNFELVYSDDYYTDPADILPDSLPRDPCFPDADPTNIWDITNLKTTPAWLKINKESGLLYGTPLVTDAPKNEKVTVICRDEDGLMHVVSFDLFVDSVNHAPRIWTKAENDCIDAGSEYTDTLYLADHDIFRTGLIDGTVVTDTLTITVLEPAGLTVETSPIYGPLSADDEDLENKLKVILRGENFDTSIADANGRITIRIEVKDAVGNTYILVYSVKVSDKVDFACPIKVENSKAAFRMLTFGTGRNATNGDGTVGDTIGQLDYDYCEHELPPVPEQDVFDSRWTISNNNGILRNIFLTQQDATLEGSSIYRASFQSGGESGITSNHFPIKLTWNTTDIPAINATETNPSGATWWISDNQSNGQYFSVNMRLGTGSSVSDILVDKDGDDCIITIQKHDMNGFIIYYDWITGVDGNTEYAFGINSVTPNPVVNQTTVTYTLKSQSNVRFELVDNLGKVIGVVHQTTNQPANTYTFELNTSNILSSGSYSLRMVAEGKASTEQIVIIK